MSVRRRKTKAAHKSAKPQPRLPISLTTRDGKTKIRQFDGRRFVHLGELRGKRLTDLEISTAGGDGHYINLRFRDRTNLSLEITPGFTVKAEYFRYPRIKTGDPTLLKKWPAIKSEK